MKKFFLLLAAALTVSSCLTAGNTPAGKGARGGGTAVFVEGSLTYPGELFPDDFRIVAENSVTGERLVFDFKYMSRDKKYPTGTGYRIPLGPGSWAIHAESRSKKVAFYYKKPIIEVKKRPLTGIDLDTMGALSKKP